MDWDELRATLVDVFETVKDSVRKTNGVGRAGLMLGLQELGTSPDGFVGAYHYMESNMIVVNKTPLHRLLDSNPGLIEPYCFHVLLHEYIHSLGVEDEDEVRRRTHDVCLRTFGPDHPATALSQDFAAFLPDLVCPGVDWSLQGDSPIERVDGFDRSNTRPYIS